MSGSERGKILLKVSGSIAAFKAAALASQLVQNGFEVRTVFSSSAASFIGAATFEGITGHAVQDSVFETRKMMAHISLDRWADLILFYPTSANSLAKLAGGLASDLPSTLFLAHDFSKPYWVAPAMNPLMYGHPATVENLRKLKSYGVTLLEPGEGRMACGEEGTGRLIEPLEVLARIQEHFSAAPGASMDLKTARKKILITSGGTVEPIDAVRSLTNLSTGKTGAQLADQLAAEGHQVTLLRAVSAEMPTAPVAQKTFRTFEDLKRLLADQLKSEHWDWVIQCAAISDFRVAEIEMPGSSKRKSSIPGQGKVSSKGEVLLHLQPREKLIDLIPGLSKNPKVQILGFKLTVNPPGTQSAPDVTHYPTPWVLHNDLSEIGFSQETGKTVDASHAGQLLYQGKAVAKFENKRGLTETVSRLISGTLQGESHS